MDCSNDIKDLEMRFQLLEKEFKMNSSIEKLLNSKMASSEELSDQKNELKYIAELLKINKDHIDICKNGVTEVSNHLNAFEIYFDDVELSESRNVLVNIEEHFATINTLSDKLQIAVDTENQLNKINSELKINLSESHKNNEFLEEVVNNHHSELENYNKICEKKFPTLISEIEDFKTENDNMLEQLDNIKLRKEELSNELKLINEKIYHNENNAKQKEINAQELQEMIKNLNKEKDLLNNENKLRNDTTDILNSTQAKLAIDLKTKSEKCVNFRKENMKLQQEFEILNKKFSDEIKVWKTERENNERKVFEKFRREQKLIQDNNRIKSLLKGKEDSSRNNNNFWDISTSDETTQIGSHLLSKQSQYSTLPSKRKNSFTENAEQMIEGTSDTYISSSLVRKSSS